MKPVTVLRILTILAAVVIQTCICPGASAQGPVDTGIRFDRAIFDSGAFIQDQDGILWIANSGGLSALDKQTDKVKVIPPWWKTWWFYALVITSVLGIGLLIHRSRSNQVKTIQAAALALQESERNYREVFNATSDALLIHDETARVLDVNDRMCALFGYERETALGLSVGDISLGSPPYSQPEAEDWVRRAVQEGPQVFEWQFKRRNGELFWSEVALHASEIAGEKRVIASVRDITERKQAEEALNRERDLVMRITETSPIGITMMDRQGRITFANARAEQVLGLTRDEIGKRSYNDPSWHITDYDGNPFSDEDLPFQQVMATGQPVFDVRHAIEWPDGQRVLLSINTEPIFDEAGQVDLMVSTIEDVTERKRIEESLRESEARYRAVIESQVDLISRYLPDTTLTFVNDAYCKFFGKTREELIGHSYLFMITPEFRELVRKETEDMVKHPRPLAGEYLNYRHDGKECWIQWVVQCINDEDDRVVELQAVGRDITELKRAEEALRESEERYRQLAEAAHDMIFIINREGNVDYANSFAARQFGRLAEEIIGRPHAELFLSGDVERQTLGLRQVLEASQPLYIENPTQFPNQRMWLGTWLVPIKDEAGQAKSILGIARDITKRKQAEEEIQRLNAELEQRVAQRTFQLEAANRELEAFSYSVSHDLRAPLRAMTGYARIISEDFSTSLPPAVKEYLERISNSGNKMAQLIDGLLAFSRLGRGRLSKREVDLNALTRTVIESLAPEIGSRQIEWTLADLPPTQADLTLIQQVFSNLIGNAVKYSRERTPACIEVGYLEKAGETIYFVRDNGVGFDMKYADRLFGVFQRLHREDEFEGTGIGLATAQRIIHRHGGRIWAEAEPDRGATFYFTLGSL